MLEFILKFSWPCQFCTRHYPFWNDVKCKKQQNWEKFEYFVKNLHYLKKVTPKVTCNLILDVYRNKIIKTIDCCGNFSLYFYVYFVTSILFSCVLWITECDGGTNLQAWGGGFTQSTMTHIPVVVQLANSRLLGHLEMGYNYQCRQPCTAVVLYWLYACSPWSWFNFSKN